MPRARRFRHGVRRRWLPMKQGKVNVPALIVLVVVVVCCCGGAIAAMNAPPPVTAPAGAGL